MTTRYIPRSAPVGSSTVLPPNPSGAGPAWGAAVSAPGAVAMPSTARPPVLVVFAPSAATIPKT